MQYRYDDLYKIFNEKLVSDYGVDWFDVYKRYLDIGNYAGIYPDTALLLMTIIANNPIRKVIEVGGGSSTLFIKKACLKHNITMTSYEESEKYLNMTRRLLESYSMDSSFVSLRSGDIDLSGADMLFIDSSEPQRMQLLRESESILNVPIVVLDDFGSPGLASAFSAFLRRSDYDRPFYVYNGVGRQDRHQVISWDPRKIRPIGELVGSCIPRIGVS